MDDKHISNIDDFGMSLSDEMLAAYIDGNATGEENEIVRNSLSDDNPYEEVFDIVTDLKLIESKEIEWEVADLIDDTCDRNYFEQNLNDTIMSYMKTTGDVEPFPNATPEEILQHDIDTCAVKSQQIVMRAFGLNIPEEILASEAEAKGYYCPGFGSDPDQVGRLLIDHGIPVHTQYDANVYDLVDELAQGHKVIVGVDADELWRPSFFNDLFGEQANHALIVTGIDTTDPDNPMVIITDPGSGDVAKQYPLDQFLDAWHDSHCEMVATDLPAPKQFNPEMANFDYEMGHLPMVGDIPYDMYHDELLPEISLYFAQSEIDDLSIETIEDGEGLSSFYDHIFEAFNSYASNLGNMDFHDLLFN